MLTLSYAIVAQGPASLNPHTELLLKWFILPTSRHPSFDLSKSNQVIS